MSFCFFAVPTYAPENVSFSLNNLGLQVKWDPLPVYFHGYVLQGYKINLLKADNTLFASYTYADDATEALIPQLTQAHGIACVTMNGFTIYGDGPYGDCALEEKEGTCACEVIPRIIIFSIFIVNYVGGLRTYYLTYLLASLLTCCLHAYLLDCLLTYLLTCLLSSLLACLLT